VSEGEIEGLIFWRRLRNNVDEREGAEMIKGKDYQQKHYQARTPLLENFCLDESGD